MVLLALNAAIPAATAFVVLTVIGSVLLLRARRHLIGTTLIGPWYWMAGVTVAMGATEIVIRVFGSSADPWPVSARFAVTATCFCPLMSLLGAKRPQDKAWHFVVVSLWAILALPAFESLVLRPGQMPDVRGSRSWFMLALVGLGLLNSLPTRLWLGGLLAALGQILMLADYLPLIRGLVGDWGMLAGFTCWVGAIAVLMIVAPRRRAELEPLTAVWLDFRDSFGALWALRVAERINAATAASKWPVTLSWSGFCLAEHTDSTLEDLPVEVRLLLRQTVENLLRRFVSPEWIAARLGEPLD